MNILVYVDLYYPNDCSGAERYIHDILKELILRGHKVKVITNNTNAHSYEGVDYLPPKLNKKRLLRWADIVMSQLGGVNTALDSNTKKPHVALMPICTYLNERMTKDNTDLLVCISQFVYDELDFLNIPRTLTRPITKPSTFTVDKGDAITLINLNENKGGNLFWDLAEKMPDRKFIGVLGGYDHQIIKHGFKNVTLYNNSPNILDVYRQTRILLFPSKEETWGMAAMEAACSGIPIIANPNPGVIESQGDAVIYANRDSYQDYIDAIKMLDDQSIYDSFSHKVFNRAMTMSTTNDVDSLEYSLKMLLTK